MIRLRYILATAVLMCCCTAMYGQSISNKGKEFWVGYGHHQFMESGTNAQSMTIYLSVEALPVGFSYATVKITMHNSSAIPALWWSRTYRIPANTVIDIENPATPAFSFTPGVAQGGSASGAIPKNPNGFDARLITDPPPGGTGGAGLFPSKGIHIESDVPIVAYAHIWGSASSGATMLLPVEAWGFEYISLNSNQSYASNCYNWSYVIAKEDNTYVEITPSVVTRANNVTGLQPGVPKVIHMMKGQIYQVIGALNGADANGNGGGATGQNLSGTRFRAVTGPLSPSACKPIAVFAGSSRTQNPTGVCGPGGGDNDNQQMFPAHAWGKKYFTTPFAGTPTTSDATSMYRVSVLDPTTVVKRNGIVLAGIQNNNYYTFTSNTADLIEGDKPIMVVQFMSGGSCIAGGLGDPDMVVLSPVEQGTTYTGFYRNTKESIDVNYVNVVVPNRGTGLSSLRIDGSSTFTRVYTHPRDPNYTVVIKDFRPATQSQCVIKGDSTFTAITYGEGSVESYSYNAGSRLNNLNAISGINNYLDTTNNGNNLHPYTSVNTPFKLSVLLRYQPTKIEWKFNELFPPPTTNIVPNLGVYTMDPASNFYKGIVTSNGIQYYKYELPDSFKFVQPGEYSIPIVAHSAGINNCGGYENLTLGINVYGINSGGTVGTPPKRCSRDTVFLSGPASATFAPYNTNLGSLTLPLQQWKWVMPNGDTLKARDTFVLLQPGVHVIKFIGVAQNGLLVGPHNYTYDIVPPPIVSFNALPDTLCLGQAVNFSQTTTYTGNSPNVNTWMWDIGSGVQSTSIAANTNFSYTYPAPGVYNTWMLARVSNACKSDTAWKTVVVNNKASIVFGYPTSCLPPSGIANFTANSTAQGGQPITSYSWNFGDPSSGSNNTSTLQNPSHTYTTAGVYNVKLTVVTNTGCSGDTTIQVNANIKPALAWQSSANFNPVCENVTPFSLAFGTVTNGVTGTPKYSGNGTDSAGTFTPSVAGPGTHTITFTFTTPQGCVETKDTTITVNPLPAKPAVVSPVNYCQNGAATALNATAGSGNTLNWFDNQGLTGGQATPYTPSTASAGTIYYYVSQTSAANCTGDTSVITVNVTPVISGNSISADQTICSNSAAAQLSAMNAPTGGTGTYNFQWQQSTNGGSSWSNISGANSDTYTPGSLTATTKFKRVITSGLCSDESNVVTITVVPALININISGAQTICEGAQPNSITGQNSGATANYQWQNSPDGANWSMIGGATSQDYQPPVLNTTTHYRRIVTDGPCSDTSSVVIITVNLKANGAISTATPDICQYNSADIIFTASSGTSPFSISYTITNPAGVTSAPFNQTGVSNTGTFNVIPTGSTAGTYTVTLTNLSGSNNCVRNSGLNSVTINVKATPVISFPSVTTPICEGDTANITASGADTYSWTGTSLITNTGATVTADPTTTTTYTVTGTTNGCNGSNSTTITVNPKPVKPSVVTPVAYCQHTPSVPLSATASTGNNLTFYDNPGLTGGQASPYTPSTATAGAIYYYVTQTSGAGCESDTAVITVNITPAIDGNTISADQTLCSGSPSTVLNSSAVTGGTGTYNYQWQQFVNPGPWNNIAGGTNPSYDPAGISTTTQFRRVITSGLCSDTSNFITITVIPALTNTDISGTQTVCENVQPNSIDGQNTGGGVTYVWQSSADGTNWTTIAGATSEDYQPPILSASTRYRRIVSAGPCTDTSSVVTVTVIPVANGTITAPANICQYGTADITFTASSGTSPFSIWYTVTNPSGGSTNVNQTNVSNTGTFNGIPTGSAAGSYTVRLDSIRNSNGCVRTTGFTPVSINVTATPVITFPSVTTPICEGDTASITASGADTYSWTGTNLLSNTGVTVTANPITTTTYTVTGTTNGCNGSNSTTITVNPKPAKPSVVTPVPYCQNGAAVPLSATATAGNTLTYYDNAGLSGGQASPYMPSTGTAGAIYYYVTQTTGAGCKSDTSIITINISPVISGNAIGADQTLCAGTPAAALNTAGTVTGGTGTYSHQWQISTDGGANWTDVVGATSPSYSPGTLTANTKFRRSITSGLCSDISNVVTITMLAPLSNYDISASQTICEATQPNQLNGQTTPGAVGYKWQSSTDGTSWSDIPGATAKDYTPPVLNVTTYYRRISDNGVCTATSSVVTITVNPLANGSISGPAAICEYNSADIIFTASTGTSPFSIYYTIINPAGGTTSVSQVGVSNGASFNVIPTGSTAGSYTIRLDSIRNNNGCTRTTGFNPITITVNPTPTVQVDPINSICEGSNPASLNATGATTYSWTGPNLVTNTGAGVTANPSVTSTYTVTGTTNGCSATATGIATVNPKPDAKFNITYSSICLDTAGIFTSNSTIDSGNIVAYYWDFDNGTLDTTNTPGPVYQYFNTHRVYNVKLKVLSDKGCISDPFINPITVNPMPVAAFNMPPSVCVPGAVAFTNASTIANGGTMSYSWDFGDASPLSSTPSPSHTYVGAVQGSSYDIKLTATSAAGCTTDTTRTFAAFFDKPFANFNVTPNPLCQGSPNTFVDLSVAVSSAIRSRVWTFGDGSSDTSAAPTKTYINAGNFPVKLQVENIQGCIADTTQDVIVYLQPKIDAGQNFVVPIGTRITFGATSNSPSFTFAWTTIYGNTPDNPGILKPSVIADQDGRYMLTATGLGDCSASDFVTIKVLKPIGIPNAFSPNKDGINDTWGLENLRDYPGCSVQVYNRYGQIVYETYGYSKPWDGTSKGKDLPVGTYYYVIDPKNGFNKMTGYVVILR